MIVLDFFTMAILAICLRVRLKADQNWSSGEDAFRSIMLVVAFTWAILRIGMLS